MHFSRILAISKLLQNFRKKTELEDLAEFEISIKSCSTSFSYLATLKDGKKYYGAFAQCLFTYPMFTKYRKKVKVF